jgi:hypothetical protein
MAVSFRDFGYRVAFAQPLLVQATMTAYIERDELLHPTGVDLNIVLVSGAAYFGFGGWP